MWGYCDPEEKSDNEKQDSVSRNRPLQQNIHQSIFPYLFIQATVYSQTTIWQDIDYKNLKLKPITKIFSQG